MLTLAGAHLERLLDAYGYAAVFVIIGLENIGLPVPGETMLITAAIHAGTTHRLDVLGIVATAAAAATAGAVAGFIIGRSGGHALLQRYGRRIHIDDRDLRLGHYLFERYGGLVVFFGRFVAFLRALASLPAGINRMDERRFLLFNALGACAWASVFGFGAYALGLDIEAQSARADLVSAALVVAVAIAGVRFLKRNRGRLQRGADRAAGAAASGRE